MTVTLQATVNIITMYNISETSNMRIHSVFNFTLCTISTPKTNVMVSSTGSINSFRLCRKSPTLTKTPARRKRAISLMVPMVTPRHSSQARGIHLRTLYKYCTYLSFLLLSLFSLGNFHRYVMFTYAISCCYIVVSQFVPKDNITDNK